MHQHFSAVIAARRCSRGCWLFWSALVWVGLSHAIQIKYLKASSKKAETSQRGITDFAGKNREVRSCEAEADSGSSRSPFHHQLSSHDFLGRKSSRPGLPSYPAMSLQNPRCTEIMSRTRRLLVKVPSVLWTFSGCGVDGWIRSSQTEHREAVHAQLHPKTKSGEFHRHYISRCDWKLVAKIYTKKTTPA